MWVGWRYGVAVGVKGVEGEQLLKGWRYGLEVLEVSRWEAGVGRLDI